MFLSLDIKKINFLAGLYQKKEVENERLQYFIGHNKIDTLNDLRSIIIKLDAQDIPRKQSSKEIIPMDIPWNITYRKFISYIQKNHKILVYDQTSIEDHIVVFYMEKNQAYKLVNQFHFLNNSLSLIHTKIYDINEIIIHPNEILHTITQKYISESPDINEKRQKIIIYDNTNKVLKIEYNSINLFLTYFNQALINTPFFVKLLKPEVQENKSNILGNLHRCF